MSSGNEGGKKRSQRQLTLRKILGYAVKTGASDIHLKVDRPPIMRVSGDIRFAGEVPITQEHMLDYLDQMMSPEEKDKFLKIGDADLALNLDDVGRFRVNLLMQRGTIAAILRHITSKVPDAKKLNLPSGMVERVTGLQRGMALITGTTGSGKSTTLAALIDIINATRSDHIVTLEDPIEFVHEDKKSSIIQREIGIDTKDFKTALRALMREDPDIILIGEMRDIETFEACTHAAETGHLVFSTLHTSNVMLTVDRIVDLFPPEQHQQVRTQLSYQLQAIVSQRLVPSADGLGRVPALEVMFNTSTISALIRDNNIKQIPAALVAGKHDHMQTFNMSLVGHIESGAITEQDAIAYSDNPEELKMNMQGIYTGSSTGGILKKGR